jgi:hypothetical protein
VLSNSVPIPDQQSDQHRREAVEAAARPNGSSVPGASKIERLTKSSKNTPLNPSNALDYSYGFYGLSWGCEVLGAGRRKAGSIERDSAFPRMWRVRLPSGRLTDMVNLTRAKDYASLVALRHFDLKVPA